MKTPFAPLAAALLLAAGAAAAADAAAARDARAEEDRRVFADGLFSRGLYAQAAAEYARFLEDFPSGADRDKVCFRLGEAHRLAGHRADAMRAYKRAADEPGSTVRHRALFQRASLFTETGDDDSAAELYTLLLDEKPEPAVRKLALYYRAAAFEGLGRAADARGDLDALLREFPSDEMASYGRLSLARILAAEGPVQDLDRSRALLHELSAAPATPRLGAEALFLLGSAEYSAGAFAAAADAFQGLFEKYPSDPRSAEARLPAAWAFCKAGRAQQALSACDSALAADPAPDPAAAVELRYVRAQSLFSLARLDDARSAFEAVAEDPAAASTPFASRARYQAALSAYKAGDWAAAQKAVRPVLSDGELRAEALWLLAEASAAGGDEDSAIDSYRRLASEFPASSYAPESLYRLGHRLQKRGDWADAAAVYHHLAEAYPKLPIAPAALFSSATCLARSGQGEKALVDWRTYLRDWPDDPGVPEALFQEALELVRLERRTEALSVLDDLLRRFPSHARKPDALFWKGELLRSAGEFGPAVAALRAALDAKPSDAIARDARFALAVSLQSDGKEDEAAALFQTLLDDRSAAARFTSGQFAWLAERQIERGDLPRAAATARRMAEAAETDEWRQTAWTLAGRAERAAGHAREAEECYRRACDLPVLTRYAPEATLRLAELLLARGDAEGAEPLFRLAVERCSEPDLQPQRIWAYIGLGHAALARGDKEAAARYLHTVCILYADPEILPPVLLETARLLDELGRADEAASLRASLRADYPESEAARQLPPAP